MICNTYLFFRLDSKLGIGGLWWLAVSFWSGSCCRCHGTHSSVFRGFPSPVTCSPLMKGLKAQLSILVFVMSHIFPMKLKIAIKFFCSKLLFRPDVIFP